ncbi:unnamed protein product [Polarella glacialis]|uniref:Uncharacterized protein n=1 Tax=Polarella glacialis TaxID=89957 RepID=A0A813GE86_POLGL|nr:unnamed protein product [Polarella glacialis]
MHHRAGSTCYNGQVCAIAQSCLSVFQDTLPCGHDASLPCHEWADHARVASHPCKAIVSTSLPCGHVIERRCCDQSTQVLCVEDVEKALPCGHRQIMPCSQDPASYSCSEVLSLPHPVCGHVQSVKCGEDTAGTKCQHQLAAVRAVCGHPVVARCWLIQQPGSALSLPEEGNDALLEPESGGGDHSLKLQSPQQVASLPIPPCAHLMTRPHQICGCEVLTSCGASDPADGLRLEEVALRSSCERCTATVTQTLASHLRTRTRPRDCDLLSNEGTQRLVVGTLLDTLNQARLVLRRALQGRRGLNGDSAGGSEPFSWRAPTPSSSSSSSRPQQHEPNGRQVGADGEQTREEPVAISVQEAMSQAGARGKGAWWRLERQFLEHRLSLPPAMVLASPVPILAPVPSENYLRQLMLRGFPPPAALASSTSSAGTASLSLMDSELFEHHIKGRRVAVLGLYLPPSPGMLHATVSAAAETARAWAYLRGEQSLEVASNQQLLPLYVIEV